MNLSIEYISLDEIKPYEGNAKLHPEEQIEEIVSSIREVGFKDPIGIWNNEIVEGHGRYEAAKRLGMTEVPVIRLDDLTDEQRKAYALIHNKTTMDSDFDLSVLAKEIEGIHDIDMSLYGFDMSKIFPPEIKQVDEDSIPDIPAETLVNVGDIWQLGGHRLICGDSTDVENIERLMDGERARFLFTSPPYSDIREYNGGKDLSVENLCGFIEACRPFTDYQCINLGIQRKNNDIVQYWDEYIERAKQCGYKFLAWNVWDKTMAGSIGQQKAFFPIRHEWIFVFGVDFFKINETWEKKADSIKQGKRQRSVRQPDGSTKYSSCGDESGRLKRMESVVSITSEQGKIREKHPAAFPVALPAEYIKAMSDEGDIVLEPFGGSGTTLIACEQLGRRCFISELDPKYCDVIIQRWENLTGEQAIKIST